VSEDDGTDVGPEAIDVGRFCREVEAHLTRENAGHIVRVVGPAFELVRGWAEAGVPLSVVRQGISRKAERHRAGRSRRPLRLEFCAVDVEVAYADWRRAVGVGRAGPAVDEPRAADAGRPSLTRHLDRVIDRLSRLVGRMDLSDVFRGDVAAVLEEVAAIREQVRTARGDARAALTSRLPHLDEVLLAAARREIDPATWIQFTEAASTELQSYRSRLTADDWNRTRERAASRLLCEHWRLPTIELV
jgi:hypothetical protein